MEDYGSGKPGARPALELARMATTRPSGRGSCIPMRSPEGQEVFAASKRRMLGGLSSVGVFT